MTEFLSGVALIGDPVTILWIMFGVCFGIVLGAIPGLTATMGIALMLPLAIQLETATGMAMLLSVYSGAIIGASVPAILLGIPGNPNAIATIYDGYPLTQQGRSAEALIGATVGSFVGGIGSLILLALFAPLIARFTLRFGPAERAALALVGLTIIASISGRRLAKGILMGAFGLALAFLGPDRITQTMRLPLPSVTMGTPLANGIQLVPALIGLFGISQALYDISRVKSGTFTPPQVSFRGSIPKPRIFVRMWRMMVESLGIGTFIGAIPGAGASIAVFLSYQRAQRRRAPAVEGGEAPQLGSGALEGVVAPEVANNACKGGALIPALSLGIPGDAATAVLLGALLIQGVVPGPTLFIDELPLVYAILGSLLLANVFMVIFQLAGISVFPKVLTTPVPILLPLILVFSLLGSYAVEGRAIMAASFNMGVALVLGIIGYFLKKNDYPIAPIVLGLILGDMLEQNFRRAMRLARGDYTVFLRSPIALAFLVLAVVSVAYALWSSRRHSDDSDTTHGEADD